MDKVKRAYWELHLAVFLFGFTAILGDLISLSALVLVWWRVFITCISLLFLIHFGKYLHKIPKSVLRQYITIGVIVALHWLTFFGAIKYANASIALVCLSTTAFFISILEPLVVKKEFYWYQLALGLIIVPAMALIVSNTEFSMQMGIWVGLLSALLAAAFSTWNKKLVAHGDPMEITFVELGSACLFLSLCLPFYFYRQVEAPFIPDSKDLLYLLVLALLCTTIAYVLSLRALRHISAFASSLTINLEPIYGILLAYFILNDYKELNTGFYTGALLILLSVLFYPLLKRRYG